VSFFSVLRRRKTLGVGMVSIFFGMGLATQSGFISPYVQFLGLPTISIFFLSYSGGAILTRVFGAKIADRIGEETIVPWAIGINAIGYLILLIVNSSGMLLVAGLVTGAGHGFLFPCLNALAIRNEPAHIRGKISGIFTGSIDAGNLLGSLLLGYIGDWFGYRPLFFTTFLILMIGLLSFMGFLKKAILRTDR
ncbi:MAG: MFS transporter, partial [Deltaproteobacteria bacterium]|nr:MFS transporter [Deltaproteobacteria bacterium]